uniref:Uncharacterized protein n=1 Tax=Anopheles arabiensis TaxID=7173 RepID=A0A182I663_ANOAR
MIMRLLPKGKNVCHKKSMPAFMYLLDQTTNLGSVDDEGRNMLHMTAQNGCFFMMHCMMSKGFNLANVNASNDWNVFHYIVLYEEHNRSSKILAYLLKHCKMVWFDLLDNMLHRNDREVTENYAIQVDGAQDTTNTIRLTKNQYGLLAWMFLLDKQDVAKLLNDHEKQEALECMKLIAESNEKTLFIKEVRNDIPQFTHRILAEYFVACWMNDNKNRMRNESFFHSWSYWNAQLHQMHDLFNRIILRESKENNLHMAVVNQSSTRVREILTNNPSTALVKDAVGRLPLHLAVTNPSLEIVNLLLDKMSIQSINTTDHLFGWSALDYAFAIRAKEYIEKLLSTGASVNEQILLQQILSNNLYQLLYGLHYYGKWLQSNESSKPIANRLYIRVVDYLLNEQRVDIFSRHEELDSKTVLEFCIAEDLLEVFKQFVLQINDPSRISEQEFTRFFKLAFENNAHKIIVHFIEDRDIALRQMNIIAGLISALKYTIQNNKLTSFKAIFQQICIQLSIPLNEENDIPDDYCVPIIPPLNDNISPEISCMMDTFWKLFWLMQFTKGTFSCSDTFITRPI